MWVPTIFLSYLLYEDNNSWKEKLGSIVSRCLLFSVYRLTLQRPQILTTSTRIRNKSNIATAACNPLRFTFPSQFLSNCMDLCQRRREEFIM
jgi:hypothetical protein